MKKFNFSIKSAVIKQLLESKEQAFYLAPDVVGSINNAYPDKKKKIFIVDFNTVDKIPLKLIVPFKTYSDWNLKNNNKENPVLLFLKSFLDGVSSCEEETDFQNIDEMVDEFGNIYDDSDDKPSNIKGSPGYYNKKSGQNATKQYARMLRVKR
jgi:hypothetical protein